MRLGSPADKTAYKILACAASAPLRYRVKLCPANQQPAPWPPLPDRRSNEVGAFPVTMRIVQASDMASLVCAGVPRVWHVCEEPVKQWRSAEADKKTRLQGMKTDITSSLFSAPPAAQAGAIRH